MKLIAHRGNISGPNEELENKVDYIEEAINQGYDVEVDLRLKNKSLFLGHDYPQYQVDLNWLIKRKNNLWIHCKDLESICYLRKIDAFHSLNYFGHDNDDYVLTSQNFLFCKPTKKLNNHCVLVMPELYNYEVLNEKCYGILTDYPKIYLNK